MKKILLLLTLVFTFTTLAAAQGTPGINKRQRNQRQSIKQGWRSGELTFRERFQIEKLQHQIRKAERKAKSDGVVTFGERWRLTKKQMKARANIYRQKHDNQDR